MGLKSVFASWSNANRGQKHGGRGFKETDLNMVFLPFVCLFFLFTFSLSYFWIFPWLKGYFSVTGVIKLWCIVEFMCVSGPVFLTIMYKFQLLDWPVLYIEISGLSVKYLQCV